MLSIGVKHPLAKRPASLEWLESQGVDPNRTYHVDIHDDGTATFFRYCEIGGAIHVGGLCPAGGSPASRGPCCAEPFTIPVDPFPV